MAIRIRSCRSGSASTRSRRRWSRRSRGIRAGHEPAMDWLTVQEAADLLRVKVSWLYERTRTNSIPHVKLGKYLRFDRAELIAWAEEFRRDGGSAGRAAPARPLSRIPR